MTIPADILSPLVDALADLQPSEADARTMVRLAGLDETQIEFSGKADTTWLNVVREAELQGGTSALLARAQAQYPNYAPLTAAAQAYAKWAAGPGPSDLPPSPPPVRMPAWMVLVAGAAVVILLVLGVLVGQGWSRGTATPTLAPPIAGSLATSTPAHSTVSPTPEATQPPTPTNEPAAGWQPPTSRIAFDWVEIPARKFTMGSNPKRDGLAFDDEQPQHNEFVDTFWIARTEVTVAQFEAFVEATGYQTTAEKEGSSYTWTGSERQDVAGASWRAPRGPGSSVEEKRDHPVTHISWDDVQAFSRWAGVRLPTEAEWEKACRGVEDSRIYPWGNNGPDKSRANYNMNVVDTTAVGSYPAGQSPYGLLDMSGNVWEWTQTKWRSDYTTLADDSPGGSVARVVRGGSFASSERYVRCAVRGSYNPDDRYDRGGFRVVVSPSHP